jgi:two-component system OmpR family response regulator
MSTLSAPVDAPVVGARLLVVDDEDALLDLLGDALRFAGYDVHVARNGLDALRAATDAAPQLILLDVNLPDLDGFEVCQRLRRDGIGVPVIFLSARDDPADLRSGFTRGGDDYVKMMIVRLSSTHSVKDGGQTPAKVTQFSIFGLIMASMIFI